MEFGTVGMVFDVGVLVGLTVLTVLGSVGLGFYMGRKTTIHVYGQSGEGYTSQVSAATVKETAEKGLKGILDDLDGEQETPFARLNKKE